MEFKINGYILVFWILSIITTTIIAYLKRRKRHKEFLLDLELVEKLMRYSNNNKMFFGRLITLLKHKHLSNDSKDRIIKMLTAINNEQISKI